MQKKAVLALLLALTLMMSGCALIEKDMEVDRQTVVITVGDTTYTKGEVLDAVDNSLSYTAYMYQMYYGQNYDVTDEKNIESARDSVIKGLIEQAVTNAKIKELGFDQFTDEEMTDISSQVEDEWASDISTVQNYYLSDSELTGDELTAACEDYLVNTMGVTKESLEENYKATASQTKLRDYVIKDVTVTDEAVQAEYDSNVSSAKDSYANSLSAYGAAVNNGRTVYYRPAGYRMVKQILIKFTDEDQTAISDLKSKRSEQSTIVSNMTSSLTNLNVENVDDLVAQVSVEVTEGDEVTAAGTAAFTEELEEDTASQVQQLAEAKALVAYYDGKIDEATDKAYADIDEAADAVIARLDAGEDFDTVMAETTQDPGMQEGADTAVTGYAVCEGFTSFDTNFTAAAMALENIGDVSPKTRGNSNGYYIIKYVSDVEEGAVDFDVVKEEVTASVLSETQDTVYEATVTDWVTAANPKTDMKKLTK